MPQLKEEYKALLQPDAKKAKKEANAVLPDTEADEGESHRLSRRRF